MRYRIQIFHPESGFFLNTNHESEDLESLKAVLDQDAFAGLRVQIVNDKHRVFFGPVTRERTTPLSVEDIAKSLGVPVVKWEDRDRHMP